MKTIIAYTLVVVGIPFFTGHLFGVILTAPIALIAGLFRQSKESPDDAAAAGMQEGITWLFRGSAKMPLIDLISHACLDVCSGLCAVFVAALIFHLFKLHLGLAVLIIVAVWEIIVAVSPGQSFRALFSSLAGVFVGWFVVLRLFSF
jgi:hypothetical protein